jgi:hypothetical protein
VGRAYAASLRPNILCTVLLKFHAPGPAPSALNRAVYAVAVELDSVRPFLARRHMLDQLRQLWRYSGRELSHGVSGTHGAKPTRRRHSAITLPLWPHRRIGTSAPRNLNRIWQCCSWRRCYSLASGPRSAVRRGRNRALSTGPVAIHAPPQARRSRGRTSSGATLCRRRAGRRRTAPGHPGCRCARHGSRPFRGVARSPARCPRADALAAAIWTISERQVLPLPDFRRLSIFEVDRPARFARVRKT